MTGKRPTEYQPAPENRVTCRGNPHGHAGGRCMTGNGLTEH